MWTWQLDHTSLALWKNFNRRMCLRVFATDLACGISLPRAMVPSAGFNKCHFVANVAMLFVLTVDMPNALIKMAQPSNLVFASDSEIGHAGAIKFHVMKPYSLRPCGCRRRGRTVILYLGDAFAIPKLRAKRIC